MNPFWLVTLLQTEGASMTRLLTLARAAWEYLREVSGENDYSRYRALVEARGEEPLTPQEFYVENLQREYSRPNRCC